MAPEGARLSGLTGAFRRARLADLFWPVNLSEPFRVRLRIQSEAPKTEPEPEPEPEPVVGAQERTTEFCE